MVLDLDLPFVNGKWKILTSSYHQIAEKIFGKTMILRLLITYVLEMVEIRFVNLMGGHIWMESEGVDKGSCVIFIVKLGNQSDSCGGRQMPPKGRPNHGSGDLVGHKPVFRDGDGASTSISIPRYQRSL